MKKKIILSAIAVSFFIGCGSSSNSSSNNSTTPTNNTSAQTNKIPLTVVDGYVIGAKIFDAKGNVLGDTNESGQLLVDKNINNVVSKGGYIDVNFNHKIDNQDYVLPENYQMKSIGDNKLITPISDLLANGVNEDILKKILGVNSLNIDPYKNNNVNIAKAFKIILAVKLDNKEKEFIDLINKVKFNNNSTTEQNSLLPNVNEMKNEESSPRENTQNNNSLLPVVKVASALPNIDEDYSKEVPQNNNIQSTPSSLPNADNGMNTEYVYSKSDINTLAELALEVLDNDNLKSFVLEVSKANISKAEEVEALLLNLHYNIKPTSISMPKEPVEVSNPTNTEENVNSETEANNSPTSSVANDTETNNNDNSALPPL